MNGSPQNDVIRFGPFEVNLKLGELRRNGYRIKLQEKPFQILAVLLERPGSLVTRAELCQRLWADNTFVDYDHNLNNAINKLREALNDSSEKPKFLATVPRRGYRFLARVEQAPLPEDTPAAGTASRQSPDSPETATGDSENGSQISSMMKWRTPLYVGAGLLLLLALFAARFFAPTRLRAHSANADGPGQAPFVIQKDGGLDPIDEGFKLHSLGHYDANVVRNEQIDGVDRWKIRTDDQAYYYRSLTPNEKIMSVDRDWKLTCICAVEQGSASANIEIGDKLRRFDIELLREGGKFYVALTKRISPRNEWEQKIEFPGVGEVEHPHTFELCYDHSSKRASLWIDGELKASGYSGHNQFLEDRGVYFGTYAYLSAKTGIGVFRSVRSEVQ